MAGFDNDRKATGVHDDLWARAVAVSDGRLKVAIVSVDLIGVFHADVLKAREALQAKAPGAALVVASTHNHEGPDTMGLWGSGRFSTGVDPQYLASVRQAIVEAAAEALSRLAPARLVLGKARTPGLIEDGRLPKVIDDTLVTMQAIGEDGRTLGTVVNWSSHPEALGAKNTLVTSDFPHYLRGRMEERLGGTCVFLVGSIGGLMTPLGVKLRDADGKAIPADSFAFAQAVGERAAEAALDALKAGKPSASSALEHRSATVFVPLENRLFRLAAFLGVLDREMYSSGQPATTLFGDDMRTEVGYLRIGDAEALLVPAEIYPELVLGGIQDPQDPGSRLPRRAARAGSLHAALLRVQARPRPRQRRDRLRDPALPVGREEALRLRPRGGPVRRDQLGRPERVGAPGRGVRAPAAVRVGLARGNRQGPEGLLRLDFEVAVGRVARRGPDVQGKRPAE